MNNFSSLSLRVLTLPDYRNPLYCYVLDAEIHQNNFSVSTVIEELARSSSTQVVTDKKWAFLSNIAVSVLEDERLWQILLSENSTFRVFKSWKIYRKKLVSQLLFTKEIPSNLAFKAISNSLYQSSEGVVLPLDYYIEPSTFKWFNETLGSQIIRFIERRKLQEKELSHIERDDVVAWLRLLFLIQNNPTHRFKEQFNDLLHYEIPYGLSPKSSSSTLEDLVKNSKTIALVPMLTGINSISTALGTGEWLVALKAAGATGATVIVLISSLAITDRIVDWMKSKRNTNQ